MGKTIRHYKGTEYRDKSKKKSKNDRKSFGWTSGTHSGFEHAKTYWKDRYEADADDEIAARMWDKYKDKTYPEKGEDFVKYGYGNGSKKKIKNKHIDESDL
jgi:hypothetical protein